MSSDAGRPVALVTGASRGIGAATARRLAADGFDVAISYVRRERDASQVVAEVERAGGAGFAVPADVAEPAAVAAMFGAVDEHFGRLDVVVNNAGVVSPLGPVESFDVDRIRRVLAINTVGTFLCCIEAVRAMSAGSGGVICNVSSRAAVLGGAGEYVDYAASKAAVDALTVGLAAEVAGRGIRVVGVRPGLIDTEIHAPGRLDRIGSSPPLGRPGTSDEVAATIAFLVSPSASYLTGVTVDVAGGR